MKRNGGTMKQWLELEWEYLCTMGNDLLSCDWKVHQVEYRDMIQDPINTVCAIGSALGLTPDEFKLRKFCDEFVRRP